MNTGYKTLTNTWMLSFICIFSFNAHADRPSYSFISFEYANRNIDGVIIDPYMGNTEDDFSFDGVALAGSIEINDKWFAELRYLKLKGRQEARTLYTTSASTYFPAPVGATTVSGESQFDSEATLTSSSIGYQVRQYENSSVFIAIGIASAEIEISEYRETVFRDSMGNVVPSGSNSWSPYSHSFGASDSGAIVSAGYRANLSEQMEFGVRVDNVFLDESTMSIAGELLYKFVESFALQVASEVADEEIQFSAGLRYIF